MTQDEMILTLLRAVARSMVCEKCEGTGQVYMGNHHNAMCSCRIAIRDLLAPKGV